MKRIMLVLVMLLMVVSVFAYTVEENAAREAIQTSAPDLYAMIKARAIEEWDTDHSMILYTITKQCMAFMHVATKMNTSTIMIVSNAIFEWSYDEETKERNITIALEGLKPNEETNTFSIDWIIKMDVDWVMVLYTTNQQLQAKGKY